ncbi:MAG: hypothetical protein ACTHKU_05725 [Verrucomicrobiota bacterium]
MRLIVQRRNRLFTLQGMGRSPAAIFLSRQEQLDGRLARLKKWPARMLRHAIAPRPDRKLGAMNQSHATVRDLHESGGRETAFFVENTGGHSDC